MWHPNSIKLLATSTTSNLRASISFYTTNQMHPLWQCYSKQQLVPKFEWHNMLVVIVLEINLPKYCKWVWWLSEKTIYHYRLVLIRHAGVYTLGNNTCSRNVTSVRIADLGSYFWCKITHCCCSVQIALLVHYICLRTPQ